MTPTRMVNVRLTDEEYDHVRDQARAEGTTVSDYVRRRIVGRRYSDLQLVERVDGLEARLAELEQAREA